MSLTIFENKRILLGVTGSIAAYKAADFASKLTQAGAQVDVILTSAAQQFITPLTFQSVTGRATFTDADLWGGSGHVTHIGLGHTAHALVIAPASANTLAKLAHGIADNLLTVTALANRGALLLAPAMDGGMFAHPSTQHNLNVLSERGALIVGPVEGRMASGLMGMGRMVEPAEILGHLRLVLGQTGALRGKQIVVSAGGTQEPIDPVRVVANRSSGKQGFALAQAALDLGAEVTLITGPVALTAPVGARLLQVNTAAEMLAAVLRESAMADALLMAAAVADFRPAQPAGQKIKKGAAALQIHLEATADILGAVAARKAESGFPRVTVGFAAESQHLLQNAQQKLSSKKLDLIAANDITAADAGFGSETNRVTLLFADRRSETLPLLTKTQVAERILAAVVVMLTK